MSTTPEREPTVLVPTSREEALRAFDTGEGVVVMGGGTILMPQLTARRLRADRILLLSRAGLDSLESADGTMRIGATVRVERLTDAPEPLGAAARGVADY